MVPAALSSCYEQSNPILFARLKNPADGLFTNVLARVSACTLTVIEEQSSTVVYATTAVTPADIFFNALVTDDARWTPDDIGYNFRFTPTTAMLPKGGRTYRFEFMITAVGSLTKHPLVFRQPTEHLLSV